MNIAETGVSESPEGGGSQGSHLKVVDNHSEISTNGSINGDVTTGCRVEGRTDSGDLPAHLTALEESVIQGKSAEEKNGCAEEQSLVKGPAESPPAEAHCTEGTKDSGLNAETVSQPKVVYLGKLYILLQFTCHSIQACTLQLFIDMSSLYLIRKL